MVKELFPDKTRQKDEMEEICKEANNHLNHFKMSDKAIQKDKETVCKAFPGQSEGEGLP